jgi:mRNA interferase MazF
MTQSDNTSLNEMLFPRFGDIWDVNLDPVAGSEIGKRRPALIVSNNSNNTYSPRITVLPITSQPSRDDYPFEVIVPRGTGGLTATSRILANQIRTIDKKRLVNLRGTIPILYIPQVEKAIKIHLNMK